MHEVPIRSCFLIEDGVNVVESWLLGGELPDVDAIIDLARGASERASG